MKLDNMHHDKQFRISLLGFSLQLGVPSDTLLKYTGPLHTGLKHWIHSKFVFFSTLVVFISHLVGFAKKTGYSVSKIIVNFIYCILLIQKTKTFSKL